VSAIATETVEGRAEALATARAAISVTGVSKTFRLPHQQYNTLKERVLHPRRASTHEELRALRDVSFEVAQGEFFGIVGRNGSGKSTMLKCLAGIYDVDEGSIGVEGRVSPFIELGVGFNADLTARDNVIINAIMLGLSRRQARARFDEIIAFAELEDFLDLKLKNYSSGMSVRLGFSVAVQADADVILVDEVLAVGDASFQQKCFEQFHKLKDEGKTILFVTHDMSAVERFCDRAMLLERGSVVGIGDPRQIGRAYNELNFGRPVPELGLGLPQDGKRAGAHDAAEIVDAWFQNTDHERVAGAGQHEQIWICIDVAIHSALRNPVFGIALRNEARQTIFATSTDAEHGVTGDFAAGERVVARFLVENHLAPSRYALTPMIARAGGGADVIDEREDVASLVVHGTRPTGGIVDLPYEFELTRR
jgi:ABC-type polysaccharide/polyol phosphate transport system ATPase subunit